MRAERARGVVRPVGMAVFLGSWAMTFFTLFVVYGVLRLGAAPGEWPPAGAPRLPLLLPATATLLLLASSVLLERGRVGAAAAAGAGFLGLQGALWLDLARAGLDAGGTYGAVFYLFTVFHALHVAVGVGALAILALSGRPAGLWRAYWHFVGVVWLVLFALLYSP
jgi:cytochrome c oxidase subunit III